MSDYIKREDAIQAIVGHLVPKQYDGNLVNAGFEVAHEIVDALPTADVVKVRHGEWIYGESEEGHDGYRCSKCGEFIPWEYDEYDIDFVKEAHYCPNCGARMDGGNDE